MDARVDPRFAQAQAGDAAALAALVAEHDGLVWFFVRSLWSADPAIDGDDLRQAGRRGLLEAILRYKPIAPFSGFAKRHIRGAALDQLRTGSDAPHVSWDTRSEDRHALADVVADEQLEPADQRCDRTARATALWQAIATLPEREQYVMRAWAAGRTFPEIATALGVSKQRAHQLYARGLRDLRAQLGEQRDELCDGAPLFGEEELDG